MLAPTGCTATEHGAPKQQLRLLQTQGSLLRLEGTSLERPTFFQLPGTEWPRARLFKGQPSPAVLGGLPRTPAYSRPLAAATAAGWAVSSAVSCRERRRPGGAMALPRPLHSGPLEAMITVQNQASVPTWGDRMSFMSPLYLSSLDPGPGEAGDDPCTSC